MKKQINVTIDSELIDKIKDSIEDNKSFSNRIEELLSFGLTMENKDFSMKQLLSMAMKLYNKEVNIKTNAD